MWHYPLICVWYDSLIYLWQHLLTGWTRRICMRNTTHAYVWNDEEHDSHFRVTWFIHMCDHTHIYMGHDSLICRTQLIDLCEMTQLMCVAWLNWHWYVWPHSYIYGTGLIYMFDTADWCVWDDSSNVCLMTQLTLMCAKWFIHMWGMIDWCAWHEWLTCVTWIIQAPATLASDNTLQHTATYCNTLERTAIRWYTLKHTATHCNTLQHTTALCNTPQHTAIHCITLQHTATHCNTLQHTATHCNTHCSANCNRPTHCNISEWCHTLTRTAAQTATDQHTATSKRHVTHYMTEVRTSKGQHTATYCNTLQHTATHCNTQQQKPRKVAFALAHFADERRFCCSVLRCVALCCRWAPVLLQSVAVCCSALWMSTGSNAVCCGVLRCVAVCCGALWCVAVCCGVLQCVAVCCSVLQCVAVCTSDHPARSSV